MFNAKIADPALNQRAAAAAVRAGLPGAAGSDAHDPAGIGAAYVEMPDFDSPASFAAALTQARIVGEHRPHAPRYPAPAPAGQMIMNGGATPPAAAASPVRNAPICITGPPLKALQRAPVRPRLGLVGCVCQRLG